MLVSGLSKRGSRSPPSLSRRNTNSDSIPVLCVVFFYQQFDCRVTTSFFILWLNRTISANRLCIHLYAMCLIPSTRTLSRAMLPFTRPPYDYCVYGHCLLWMCQPYIVVQTRDLLILSQSLLLSKKKKNQTKLTIFYQMRNMN